MYSMTGFGKAELTRQDFQISVDIRSVNSRFLDVRLRVPREAGWLEPDLRKLVQSRIRRGRLDLSLELRSLGSDTLALEMDTVRNYLKMAETLEKAGVEGKIGTADLLAMPGTVYPRTLPGEDSGLREAVLKAAERALDRLVELRQSEGKALKQDLEKRIGEIRKLAQKIQNLADEVRQHHRARLQARLKELIQNQEMPEIDEGRLAQEVLYYGERSDISEELTRLESHLGQFEKYLGEGFSKSVGRSLDFLCQELNREVTTILSKASQVDVSGLALEAKAELERVREQVQNVE